MLVPLFSCPRASSAVLLQGTGSLELPLLCVVPFSTFLPSIFTNNSLESATLMSHPGYQTSACEGLAGRAMPWMEGLSKWGNWPHCQKGWAAADLDRVMMLQVSLKAWKRRLKEWRCWALLILFLQLLPCSEQHPLSSCFWEHSNGGSSIWLLDLRVRAQYPIGTAGGERGWAAYELQG